MIQHCTLRDPIETVNDQSEFRISISIGNGISGISGLACLVDIDGKQWSDPSYETPVANTNF